MRTRSALWQVSLSTGETFQEGHFPFQDVPGDLSPWQRLLQHISAAKARITSLSLFTEEGRTWQLPSNGKNPRFRAFTDLPPPLGFRFFRVYGQDMNADGVLSGEADHFSVIAADYPACSLQVWVSETHPDNSWALVCPPKP